MGIRMGSESCLLHPYLQDTAVVCEGQHCIRPQGESPPASTCTREKSRRGVTQHSQSVSASTHLQPPLLLPQPRSVCDEPPPRQEAELCAGRYTGSLHARPMCWHNCRPALSGSWLPKHTMEAVSPPPPDVGVCISCCPPCAPGVRASSALVVPAKSISL
jgi:hypothetical protein